MKRHRFKIFVGLLFILYCLILIKLILFKSQGRSIYATYYYPEITFRQNFVRKNLIPFRSIAIIIKEDYPLEFKLENILGNIFGFSPFGFFLPVLFNYSSYRKLFLAGFAISLSFEYIQLVALLGIFDVDDILLNTGGTVIGYYIYNVIRKNIFSPQK